MSQYITSPFKPPVQLLIPGTPSYLWGSFNARTGPTIGRLISDAGAATVGTAVFQIQSGNAPAVGSLVTIVGASNNANFNVTNAVILTAVTNMDTGVCTITFAISSTTQATLADNGIVQIPQPEVGEAVVAGASVPVSASFSTANPDQGKVITAIVSFPSSPAGLSVTSVVLQGADQDIDSEYVNVSGTIASVAGGVVTGGSWNSGQGTVSTIQQVNQLNFRFYRFFTTGVTGTGTIVAKIED